jgi:acyl-coenzyme A thioesterase PaaI-like protein
MAAWFRCNAMAEAKAGFYIHVPFIEHLGIRILEKGDGVVRLRLDPRSEFENSWGAANGPVLAEERAQRAGRSLIFSEGELRNEDGTLLAKATGTFKLLYPKPQD